MRKEDIIRKQLMKGICVYYLNCDIYADQLSSYCRKCNHMGFETDLFALPYEDYDNHRFGVVICYNYPMLYDLNGDYTETCDASCHAQYFTAPLKTIIFGNTPWWEKNKKRA